jgi:hypothetical protein
VGFFGHHVCTISGAVLCAAGDDKDHTHQKPAIAKVYY